jgi:EpsG family
MTEIIGPIEERRIEKLDTSSNSQFSIMPRNLLNLVIYVVLTIFLAFLFGFRSVDIGADTETYLVFFESISLDAPLIDDFLRIEPGFYWITWLISCISASPSVYLFTIFVIQFLGVTSGIGKRSVLLTHYFYLTLVWLAFPLFYALTLNVLRQGLAFVLIIYAIDQRFQGRKISAYLLIISATQFHYAMGLYLLGFAIADYGPRLSKLVIIWLSMIVLAFFGFFGFVVEFVLQILVILGLKIQFVSYSQGVNLVDYQVGFRWDFIIVSTFPILYLLIMRICGIELTKECLYVSRLYIVTNALYFAFIDFPYNDRLALMSWAMIPLVVNIYGWKRPRYVGIVTLLLILIVPFVIVYEFLFREHFAI